MERKKIGAIIIILVVFLLGAVAGYSLSTIVTDAEAKKEEESPYGNVSDYLKKRLNLDQDQIVKYESLVEERREKMSQIHKERREMFREQTDSLRDEIRAILTDDQRVEYERFIEEYTEYRKQQRKNR